MEQLIKLIPDLANLKAKLLTRKGEEYKVIGYTNKGVYLEGIDEIIWYKNVELILNK